MATAYRVHPYGVPPIGHMSDLRNLTRGQARDYYDRFYGARNAVVAVVGDVEADSIRSWAERYLGRVRPGTVPEPVLAREPEQEGERRTRVVFDAEPRLKVGWNVVDAFHPDRPALIVLTSLLTGGRTSRLHRRMVQEDRVASFVSSSVGPGDLYPGHFSIDAVPRDPHTPAQLERVIYEELDRLREAPPEPVELERVRNQLEASRVRRLESNFGLAFQIARSATLYGDWRTTFRFTGRLQEVTAADVQRVVRRYFIPENRTVTTLVPEEEATSADADSAPPQPHPPGGGG
jgi:predicted Zn-dependent peptidase